MVCVYSFTGQNGETVRIEGKNALKAYLASGGLQHLLPEAVAKLKPIPAAAQAMFSRENLRNPTPEQVASEKDGAARALLALGAKDGLFASPRSYRLSVESIAKDKGIPVARQIMARNKSDLNGVTVVEDGEETLSGAMAQADADKGLLVWYVQMPNATVNGKTVEGSSGYITQDGDQVYINVAGSKEGTGGSGIYDLAANYAANNGLTFIGDPAGVSDAAMSRRLENMLSAAVKYGSTDFIEPHPDQIKGRAGVPAFNWKKGDTVANIQSMLEASVKNNERQSPFATSILGYDTATNSFFDRTTGFDLSEDEVTSFSEADGRVAGVGKGGSRTVKRAVTAQSLLQSADARRQFLDSIRSLPDGYGESLGGLTNTYYSRGRTGATGETVEVGTPEQRAMVERIAKGLVGRWVNRPKIEFFHTLQDANIPEAVREEDARQRANGATGHPEGFYFKGTIYTWYGLTTPEEVQRVVFHEGLGHFGLRGVFGQALKSELDQLIALRKKDVLERAKSYGGDLQVAAEEVLAFMAQETPNIGFVRRAVAAIRTWLRQNVPGFADMQLSDAEIIRDFILPARRFVEQGAAQQGSKQVAGRLEPAMSRTDLPATIEVDGKQRPMTNSNGQPIHSTQDGVRNFWRWFGDSKVVDAEGRPLVVYHGTNAQFDSFRTPAHFGDVGQANQILEFITESGKAGEQSVIPAYLRIVSPKRIRDAGSNPVKWLVKRGQFEEQGFDGFVYRNAIEGKGRDSWVAFNPTQIKSATGNSGAFSGSNPSIRFSRSQTPEPTGLTPPEQGLLRRVQAAAQDNQNRVRQVQERISKLTGAPVPEFANYYGAETQRPGRIAARLEDFQRNMTEPLVAELAKSGHTLEQLGELLHAMHAAERNERVAKINPDMPDGGSGMTNKQADEILRKYKTDRELHKLADKARAMASATLDLKRAYGLIDAETYDGLKEQYQYYVPLKGDGEYGPKIKRAMGHEEREEFILQNIARDYQQAVVVGEKHLARQSLLQMVLTNPDPELWTVGVLPKGRYVAGQTYDVYKGSERVASFQSQSQAQAWVDGRTDNPATYMIAIDLKKKSFDIEKDGKVIMSFDSHSKAEQYLDDVKTPAGKFKITPKEQVVREFVKPLQDNEVPVYVDGQLVRIQIHDETLARQLRPLNQQQMNPILEFMRSTNRYLSKIYTGYNPAFIIRNTTRDAMTGTINILGNEGAVTAAKAWTNYPAAMKALFAYAATGKVPTGETGKMLQEYRQHGGKTGASWMSDLEEQGKTLQRLYDDAYGATGYLADKRYGKAAAIAGRKIVGGMAHSVEVLNQATENGLRLALYMAMRQQGKTAGEAAQAAKSVTVDFDRKGTMSPVLGAIYLFFNPAVQGTANAIKTLFKGQHKAQAWTALATLAALGFFLASKGIDDDKDRWLGEGWESRSKNMMINIGGHTIKVPTSMEFAPFYGFGVALAEASRGATGKMAAAGRIVSSFIDAYFPLQGAFNPESDNHGMDAAMAAVPTILKPGMQIAANRNQFGSQVYPENDMTKGRPDNQKMFRGTKGTAYDATAQAIAAGGETLGFGRYENDITKVSPETLKLMWRTYTGGLGQFVADVGGLANVGTADGANLEAADIPIVKDFVKTNDVKAIRSRYFELTKEARAVADEYRQAKKAGDGEAMDKILDRPDKAELLGFDRLIQKTTKAAAAIRDEMVDINSDKDLSLAEKRAKLRELEKVEEEIYRDAIEAFR